jgi:hypothetical protein
MQILNYKNCKNLEHIYCEHNKLNGIRDFIQLNKELMHTTCKSYCTMAVTNLIRPDMICI